MLGSIEWYKPIKYLLGILFIITFLALMLNSQFIGSRTHSNESIELIIIVYSLGEIGKLFGFGE